MIDTPTNTYATRYASYRAARMAVEPREPRCRVCRHPEVRRLVDDLLDLRGAPLILDGGRKHRLTLADIFRRVQPLNEGRDKRDRLTYDALWIHNRRHHDLAGVEAYWRARMIKDLKKAFGADTVQKLLQKYKQLAQSTKIPELCGPSFEPL